MTLALLLSCLDAFPRRESDFDADGVAADEDCDDENPDTLGPSRWFLDTDGDGYGGELSTVLACDPPASAYASSTDCDDANETTHPNADESCDGFDNDCNGDVDDISAFGAKDADYGWIDADGDDYGDGSTEAFFACADLAENGFDCDDANGAINPAAPEKCGDDIDNDCDRGCGDCCFDEDGTAWPNYIYDAWFTLYSDPSTDGLGRAIATGDLFGENEAPANPESTAPERASFAASAPGGGPDGAGVVVAVPRRAMGPGSIALNNKDAAANVLLLHGHERGDQFGSALATIDPEGLTPPVLLVGAPGTVDTHASSLTDEAVYWIDGPLETGAVDLDQADIAFRSRAVTDTWFGSDILTGFDFDGNETNDVLVAGVYEPLTDEELFSTGAVWLFADAEPGDTSSADTISGSAEQGGFGTSLAAADLNGDAVDDLVVGAPGPNGPLPQVCVFLGRTPGFGSIAETDDDLTFVSALHGANLGSALALADFDGDGSVDVAAGASKPGDDGLATVHMYLNDDWFGKKAPGVITIDSDDMTFLGNPADLTGAALAARDADGDGSVDLIVGSPGTYDSSGAAYVVRMPVTDGVPLDDASATWVIPKTDPLPQSELGFRVGAESFDEEDDWVDLILAAPGAASAVYIWRSAGY